MNRTVEYQLIQDSATLDQYREQWNALALRSTQRSPMLTYEWFRNSMLDRDSDQQWACVVANCQGNLVAVLSLIRKTERKAELVGVWSAPFSSHLNITDILVDSDYAGQAVSGLLDFAFSSLPNAGYLEFCRTPDTSPALNQHGLANLAHRTNIISESTGYYLEIPDDFLAFESSLSKNFKSNLRKARNKLNKLTNVRYEFLDHTADSSVCLARFSEIEKSGWKGKRGTAIGCSTQLVGFYERVLASLRETVEWYFLVSDEADLAGFMAFRFRDRVVLWKLCYNEAYSSCAPGNQLMRELIRRESAAGLSREIDMTTDQAWYKLWHMANRAYRRIRVYHPDSFRATLQAQFDYLLIGLRRSSLARRLRNLRARA